MPGYYASVQKLLMRMSAESMREFAQLTTDEARVRYVINLQGRDDILRVTQHFRCKSDQKAQVARERGNALYAAKKFDEALTEYNRAVVSASWPMTSDSSTCTSEAERTPLSSSLSLDQSSDLQRTRPSKLRSSKSEGGDVTTSTQLALALGNRSATLMQMHKFDACAADVDLALATGFPSHLRYKLLDRKGRCLAKSGNAPGAVEALNAAIASLEVTNLKEAERERITNVCLKEIQECHGASGCTEQRPSLVKHNRRKAFEQKSVKFVATPPVLLGTNQALPTAATGILVSHSPTKGRCIMTSEQIKPGDVIISERPFASVLSPRLWSQRCYACMTSLPLNPVACFECSAVRFCTTRCLTDAWHSFHRYECRYLALLTASGTGIMAQLALRTLLVTSHKDLLQYATSSKQTTGSLERVANGFVALTQLLSHSETRDSNELFQFAILAVYLRNVLLHAGFVADLSESASAAAAGVTPQQLSSCVGATLLRVIQVIACNGIEITQLTDGATLNKTNPETVGLALAPTVALLNHSCDPLAEVVFYDDRCVVQAVQPIEAGAEVCIDYGYLFYTTSRSERQSCLKAQYHFDCDCQACAEKWPLKSKLWDGIPPLKCTECGARLKVLKQRNPQATTCSVCAATHNVVAIFDNLRTASETFERAVAYAREFDAFTAVPMLEEHLTMLRAQVALPYKEYTSCVSTLKQCFRLLANKSSALKKRLEVPE